MTMTISKRDVYAKGRRVYDAGITPPANPWALRTILFDHTRWHPVTDHLTPILRLS